MTDELVFCTNPMSRGRIVRPAAVRARAIDDALLPVEMRGRM